jgi:hypothetical protein
LPYDRAKTRDSSVRFGRRCAFGRPRPVQSIFFSH